MGVDCEDDELSHPSSVTDWDMTVQITKDHDGGTSASRCFLATRHHPPSPNPVILRNRKKMTKADKKLTSSKERQKGPVL